MSGTKMTLDAGKVKINLGKAGALGKDKSRVRAALRIGALPIVNAAKEKAPYLTGNLRRSLAVEDGPGDFEVSIGTDVEYAPYLEFGTRYMAPRPYLRPAFDENLSKAQSLAAKAFWQMVEDEVS